MQITGEALIGGASEPGDTGTSFTAWNPALRCAMAPDFVNPGPGQIAHACGLADQAFDVFRATRDSERATLLDTIGEQILALGEALIERAMAETGLPRARLEGERARTVTQLKLFAAMLREGSWRDLRVDAALPERQPPRADLRMRMVGLGPVAVFGASNFPLAFSVAGGDTAAALAAGCPVVAKAHPGHPGTAELVGRAVQHAVRLCGLPPGVFALLPGFGNAVGTALVVDPHIQAVGFTGSRAGGIALMAVAAGRRQPIPVYAEMSSINPVFLLPHALAARAAEVGAAFAASLTMGVGQFCTNPGLVLGVAGEGLDRFCDAATRSLETVAPAPMLTPGIAGSYQHGVRRLRTHSAVGTLALGEQPEGQGGPALFRARARDFLADAALHEEVFGPAALVLACDSVEEMRAVAASLEGQLTVTLQMDDGDLDAARALLPLLERKAGRIVVNGFPTGVEVCDAMVHGGPFPATSDGRSTSVGTGAIARFLRPVAYQNMPPALLPVSLRDQPERAHEQERGDSDVGSGGADAVADRWIRRDGVLERVASGRA